eukprot:973457_1
MENVTASLVRSVAPESLSLDSEIDHKEDTRLLTLLQPNIDAIQTGDFILVRTPGTFYGILRALCRNPFDHVAIVVSGKRVLHVGPSKTRFLPLVRLLTPKRAPLVLRPKLSLEQRSQLVAHCEKLVGKRYDVIRLYSLIGKLIIRQWLHPNAEKSPKLSLKEANSTELVEQLLAELMSLAGEKNHTVSDVKNPPSRPTRNSNALDESEFLQEFVDDIGDSDKPRDSTPQSANMSGPRGLPGDPKWICTDAVLWSLSHISSDFREAVRSIALDLHEFGSSTINDFLTLLKSRPDLLEKVNLPLRIAKVSKSSSGFRIFRSPRALFETVKQIMPTSTPDTKQWIMAGLTFFTTLPQWLKLAIELAILLLFILRPGSVFRVLRRVIFMWALGNVMMNWGTTEIEQKEEEQNETDSQATNVLAKSLHLINIGKNDNDAIDRNDADRERS